MKNYAPFLLYQVARFGALSVPQMLRVCEGKCKRSALYRSVGELFDQKLLSATINGATRTRAYLATPEGRRTVFGYDFKGCSAVRPSELDHTVAVAQVLLELCRYENVTGIATPFEVKPDELSRFCYDKIPDGIVRLTQDGDNFELALEVETSLKATDRARQLLDRYWQTFRRGMECSGLLVIAATSDIYRRYQTALSTMAPEFVERVKLIDGICLEELNPKAFGQKTKAISTVLELTRSSSMDEICYTSVKSEVFLAQTAFTVPTPRGSGPHTDIEGLI